MKQKLLEWLALSLLVVMGAGVVVMAVVAAITAIGWVIGR